MATTTTDAVARYRSASEANDFPGLSATLAEDVELISPLSARAVFRGRRDLAVLAEAVYTSLRNWGWDEEIGEGRRRVLIGEGRIGPLRLTDVTVLELDVEGQIQRIRPHLRPWLASSLLALTLGAKLSRTPGVLLRAMRD